jgi:hypothetical protein
MIGHCGAICSVTIKVFSQEGVECLLLVDVVALNQAGLKDVSYHRLAAVGHCPHSLVRVPALRTVVNDFFLRTLVHPKSDSPIQPAKGLP